MRTSMEMGEVEIALRARVLRLLADCYYQPGPELGRTVGELESVAARLDAQAGLLAAAMLPDCDDTEELVKDYSRLFLGPFSLLAPPYSSVYLDQGRAVMGPSTWAVLEEYQAEGLQLDKDFNEVPDHIAVELEFLHYLAAMEHGAASEGNGEEAKRYRDKRLRFTTCHLTPWLDQFASLVKQEAHTTFYKNLAELTLRIVEHQG